MRPIATEKYQTYSPDTKVPEAMAAFERKYGYKPERVFEWRRLVWAGPITKGGEK